MHEFPRAAAIIACSAMIADLIGASVMIAGAMWSDNGKGI